VVTLARGARCWVGVVACRADVGWWSVGAASWSLVVPAAVGFIMVSLMSIVLGRRGRIVQLRMSSTVVSSLLATELVAVAYNLVSLIIEP
jgi:hypothetical protein